MAGVAEAFYKGDDLEIFECDKVGNVQQRWVRASDGRLAPVCNAIPNRPR